MQGIYVGLLCCEDVTWPVALPAAVCTAMAGRFQGLRCNAHAPLRAHLHLYFVLQTIKQHVQVVGVASSTLGLRRHVVKQGLRRSACCRRSRREGYAAWQLARYLKTGCTLALHSTCGCSCSPVHDLLHPPRAAVVDHMGNQQAHKDAASAVWEQGMRDGRLSRVC
jgi:hypothetical protein